MTKSFDSGEAHGRVTILSSVHLALDNRVFYREARTLAQAGYDVTLIAVHGQDEIRDGVRIVALPRVSRWQRPLQWRRLLNAAISTKADIYHFHDPELLLMSPLLRLRTGRPTIYDIHEVYPEFIEVKDYLPRWLRQPLARSMGVIEPWLAAHESGLIFADNQIAAAFATISLPKTTLFNYPDLSQLNADELPQTDLEARPPTVLYLGGMERNRGVLLMLEAFSAVLREISHAQLLLVGHFAPPELEEEVRQVIQMLGLQASVQIVGPVPFAEVPHYLNRATVGWIPWQAFRKNELNIPTKLFEYMSALLPVVASDLPSIRPYIDPGESGYVVPPADAQAHADAIVHLLRHPELAAGMGRHGHLLVQTRYNWAMMTPRLLALYEQLIGAGRVVT